jgi:hypothetical protein
MRTIRSICLTALILIALCGVGSYFTTKGLHDVASSTNLLFGLTWIFSGLGVTGAAILVGACLSSKSFGKRALIGELFGWFGGAFAFTAIVLGMIAWASCDGFNSLNNTEHFDGARFCSIYLAALAGLIVGFLGIVLVNAKDSWIGESEDERPVRLRKVS